MSGVGQGIELLFISKCPYRHWKWHLEWCLPFCSVSKNYEQHDKGRGCIRIKTSNPLFFESEVLCNDT